MAGFKKYKKESIRQKALRLFYPLLIKADNWMGRNTMVLQNNNEPLFQTSIYDLPVVLNDGTETRLRTWHGKKLLVVNTASHCGYTAQYTELQHLQDQHTNTLQVLGFPSNDFKNQEPESDRVVAQFCQQNFGVTFPLAQKSSVIKGPRQHLVYQWLTQPEKNGWNSRAPRWNFSKYLINEDGALTHYFDPAISPLSKTIISAVEA